MVFLSASQMYMHLRINVVERLLPSYIASAENARRILTKVGLQSVLSSISVTVHGIYF